MSEELTKFYKVIQPVVYQIRREIGEILELTAEEAQHLAAFITPADPAPASAAANESSDQENTAEQGQGQTQTQPEQPTNADQAEQPAEPAAPSASGDQPQQST